MVSLVFFFSLYTELTPSIADLKQQLMSLATTPWIWKTDDKGEFATTLVTLLSSPWTVTRQRKRMSMFTVIRVRQSSGLLKHPGRHERHLTREPQSHLSGKDFERSSGGTSCSNRANFYVQAGFKGPWLAESIAWLAWKFWTNSLTVHLSTFLSQWLWPWIDLYF